MRRGLLEGVRCVTYLFLKMAAISKSKLRHVVRTCLSKAEEEESFLPSIIQEKNPFFFPSFFLEFLIASSLDTLYKRSNAY